MRLFYNYQLLGKILNSDYSKNDLKQFIDSSKSEKFITENLTKLADRHLILTAFYSSLQEKHLTFNLSPSLKDHLEEVYLLNLKRNQAIIDQVLYINSLLKPSGILPLYLKGTANLLDGLYNSPGDRILHDIDFLVKEKDFDITAEILIENGYSPRFIYDSRQKPYLKHYPILENKSFPAFVEVHRIPVRNQYLKGLKPESLFEEKLYLKAYDSFVPSDKHKLIHNFIHSQLEDRGAFYGKIFLRSLFDLLLLSKRLDIEETFHEYGRYKRQSSSYLDVFYDSFCVKPSKKLRPFLYFGIYKVRYNLNLKSRFINITTHILARFFLSYIQYPVMALFKKEIRISLLEKIRKPDFVRKQLKWYSDVLRGNMPKKQQYKN